MKKNISKILLLMMACIIAYLFLLPLLFMVFTSFKGVAESVTSTTLLPKEWTFENYIELFHNTDTSPVIQWLINTAIITICGTALRITTSVLAAYALARLNVPGKKIILIGLIWAMAIPEIVTYFPLFYIFKQIGGLNTYWALILPSGSGVMCIYLIYNFLIDFPKELEEAGKGAIVYGRDIVTGLPMEKEIPTDLVSESMLENFNVIIDNIRVILERTPPELSADIFRRGLYLTGGASQVNHLAELLAKGTGLKVNVSENPVSGVALGLAKIIKDDNYKSVAYLEGMSR